MSKCQYGSEEQRKSKDHQEEIGQTDRERIIEKAEKVENDTETKIQTEECSEG